MEDYLNRLSRQHSYAYWVIREDTLIGDGVDTKVIFDDDYLKSDLIRSYTKNLFIKRLYFKEEHLISPTYLKSKKGNKIKQILPYLSFIQRQFEILTCKCKPGIYFSIKYQSFVHLRTNQIGYCNYSEPVPDEAFMLVKAFTHLQKTMTVPEYLISYIEEQMALDLLKG